MIRLETKNCNKILTENVSKYLLCHQTKLIKYEYLTGEEILWSNRKQMIEQATFTYSPLGKAFETQIKTIENQGERKNKSKFNIEYKLKQLKKIAMMIKIVY